MCIHAQTESRSGARHSRVTPHRAAAAAPAVDAYAADAADAAGARVFVRGHRTAPRNTVMVYCK